jgi:hypothetical protein
MGMEFVLLRIRADIMDFVNCHSSTEEGKKEGLLPSLLRSSVK